MDVIARRSEERMKALIAAAFLFAASRAGAQQQAQPEVGQIVAFWGGHSFSQNAHAREFSMLGPSAYIVGRIRAFTVHGTQRLADIHALQIKDCAHGTCHYVDGPEYDENYFADARTLMRPVAQAEGMRVDQAMAGGKVVLAMWGSMSDSGDAAVVMAGPGGYYGPAYEIKGMDQIRR
jgi:hypothetical protein